MGIQGFEERLAKARKDKGYTQEEVANKLGVTPQAVSKWERGIGYPDLNMLHYISEIMDCSIDYLLHTEKKNQLSEFGNEHQRKLLLDTILAEPVVIEAGNGLVPLLMEEYNNQFKSIHRLREELAIAYGALLPLVRIRDNTELGEFEYRITAYDRVLYSATVQKEEVTFWGICEELKKVCRNHYDKIINRQVVQTLVDNTADKYPAVVRGIVPEKIQLSLLQKVLSGLVMKGGSIRNLIKIIEHLEDEIQITQDAGELTDIIFSKL